MWATKGVGSPRFAPSLALLVWVAACGEPTEIDAWVCPPIEGQAVTWPTSSTAIHGEPGTAPMGARRVVARLGDVELGHGPVHVDGSFLMRAQRQDGALEGARVVLTFEDASGSAMHRAWVRVPEAAPVTFFSHDQQCDDATWTLDVDFHAHDEAAPVESMRGIDMSAPSSRPVDPVPLSIRVTREIPVARCSQPWMLFARHENGTVSGCWDTCPPGATRCGGCTRAAWAAGICDLPDVPDEPMEMPDAGLDAGVAMDAGPLIPPD